MCGRFNVTHTPGLAVLLGRLGVDLELTPSGVNIAPTETVALVRDDSNGERRLDGARWWLTPSFAKAVDQKYAMFNARAEGLCKSPAFRKPFACQRGIVPMASFIEWRGEAGTRLPWLISNADQALAAAALWDVWIGQAGESLLSCTLVTTAAAPEFAPWHKRMPVLLAAKDQERWLDNRHAVRPDDPLLAPTLRQDLHLLPLAKAVGNSRNKDARILEPVGKRVVLSAPRLVN